MRPILIAAAILMSATPLVAQETTQQTKTVTPGPEYAASGTMRKWFGEGYRDVWTSSVEVPVLDLQREAGGLEPVRQVGGLQTAGLALRGADGKSYTFRSLHKEPERLLPEAWRRSWPARLLRDATSATHPGASLIVPVLAEAAGVPHVEPKLVVMPDDPRLGQFRATFANQVGTFEEYPTPSAGSDGGFDHAAEIIPTRELWVRWLQGAQNRIDSQAFLRARVLDLFIEDYDRRRGQWRWMRVPGKTGWEPLPEDRDMAFVRHNGVVIASMRARQPRLLEFSGKYSSSLEGPTSNGAEVDRWLLSDLDGAAFTTAAQELQKVWTDEVIDRATARLPKEWQALDHGAIAQALKARRAALVPYIQRFYRYLARDVDVHLTDLDDQVSISTAADRSTTITATAPGASAPYYSRRFLAGETSEVRVYLQGGNDRVTRSGHESIHVRLISGGGEKQIQSPDTRTEVWTDAGTATGSRIHDAGSWKNPAPIADAPWLEPRNFGNWTLWQPVAWYTQDLGVVAGATLTHSTYGFRSVPSEKEQNLRGGWSFGQSSGKIEYDGLFKRPASPLAFDFRTFVSGIEHVNFYGFGNDTGSVSRSQYHIGQTLITIAPAARFGGTRASLSIGPELRYSDTGKRTGTILFEQAPYGIGRFGIADVRVQFEADTQPSNAPGLMAVALGESTGETPDLPPGRGLRVLATGYAAPAIWDVAKAYGGVDGYLSGYVGNQSVQLAARVGGQRVFGDYPWFDAAFIGGRNNRGFHSHRFAGDASLYGSTELRAYLGGPVFASIFPVRFGLVGFVDTGRVWLNGESSNAWHPSEGGGVLLKPVGTTMVLRAVAAHSSEGTLFYAGSGFRF
jgi:hypothetical protein